jgi:hypothetical protein
MESRTSHPRIGSRLTEMAAAVCLVVVAPVIPWWIIGDQSIPGRNHDDLNYMIEPSILLPPWVEHTLGLTSAMVALASVRVLTHAVRQQRLDPRWCVVLAPFVLAGLMLGAGWRVVTAGVLGANIGGGLLVMFGGPVVLVLMLGGRYPGHRPVVGPPLRRPHAETAIVRTRKRPLTGPSGRVTPAWCARGYASIPPTRWPTSSHSSPTSMSQRLTSKSSISRGEISVPTERILEHLRTWR